MQRRIADIELLRGFAIALVLLHEFKRLLINDHSAALNALFARFDFWIGVDILFAISGFVITVSLLPNLGDNPPPKRFFVEATAFWIKRIWRLWPSAWLWLALTLLAVIYGNRSGVFGGLTTNIEALVVALIQVANFRFADMASKPFEYGASFVYWTLSLQTQFYILLPLAMFALRHRLPAAIAALIVIKAVLALLFPHLESILLAVLLHADALLLGALLGFWSKQPSYRLFEPTLFKGWAARLMLWPLLLVCLCAMASDSLRVLPSPFRYSVIAALATATVFIASYDRSYLVGSGPLRSLLLWLGNRSYSFYLVHVPVFLLTKELWFRLMPADTVFDGSFNIRFTLTAIPLLIVLSELNYRLLERPLRNRGVRIAERFRAVGQESEQQQAKQQTIA